MMSTAWENVSCLDLVTLFGGDHACALCEPNIDVICEVKMWRGIALLPPLFGILNHKQEYSSSRGDHVFVPFAMEDGGTLGAHAFALLKSLAEYAVARGCFSSLDSRARRPCSGGGFSLQVLLATVDVLPSFLMPFADDLHHVSTVAALFLF